MKKREPLDSAVSIFLTSSSNYSLSLKIDLEQDSINRFLAQAILWEVKI